MREARGAGTRAGGPMIHHLLPSSPYTRRFLQLLEDHPEAFPPHEHTLWVERADGDPFAVAGTGRIRCHLVSPWGSLIPCLGSSGDDRIVIHQLSNPRLLLYLSLFRWTARRCAWVYWGGDIYYFQYRPRTWPHALREFLRRWVIPAIPLVAGLVPGDFEVVRKVYGTRARYLPAFYPLPMDFRTLEAGAPPAEANRPVTLLVGNSGDPSNAHEWVFRALARFRPEGLRILSPLSYGDPVYVASVIALGKELFGDQFTPLTEFLPPEQYARLIREVDAAVMNHGYQQALGNVVALLMLGKKVYVRSDTTPFRYLQDLGVAVFDTLRLPDLTLAELVEFAPEAGQRNAEAVRAELSEARAVAGWQGLFRALQGAGSAGPGAA